MNTLCPALLHSNILAQDKMLQVKSGKDYGSLVGLQHFRWYWKAKTEVDLEWEPRWPVGKRPEIIRQHISGPLFQCSGLLDLRVDFREATCLFSLREVWRCEPLNKKEVTGTEPLQLPLNPGLPLSWILPYVAVVAAVSFGDLGLYKNVEHRLHESQLDLKHVGSCQTTQWKNRIFSKSCRNNWRSPGWKNMNSV